MDEVFLIKYGEIALKGQNKRNFENKLISNIKKSLKSLGEFSYINAQSTLYVKPENDVDMDRVEDKISKVFGIAAYSKACIVPKNLNDIFFKSEQYLKHVLANVKTFKVEAKRADKSFQYTSPQICEALGEYLLDKFPNLSVDVHNPDFTVFVEIRDFNAFIHGPQIKGSGGLPTGCGGKACVLISGGIDSPVASYLMGKRGLTLSAVHFASPPYTSERAELKVKDLLNKVSEYTGNIKLHIVPFTKIQDEIRKNCKEEYFTIIMRRFMMRISQILAKDDYCSALITGESLGQVASQTLDAMVCTDSVCNMPVFRPLISHDKDDIVNLSRKIGTFDISILPYEDCCTVFVPAHPKTRPKIEDVIAEETKLDLESLISEAVKNNRIEYINS